MPDASRSTPGDADGRKSRRGGFASDVTKLASGTAVAQLLVLAAAPVLARLFSPADYGAAAIFGSLSAILVSIACLCYEQAILLPQDDGDAASLLGVACIAGLATSTICAAVCVVFQQSIQHALNWSGVPGWPWLLALAALLGALTSAIGYWHSRKRDFGRVSWARVGGSLTTSAWQLGAGALGSTTSAALIHGSVSGSAATTVVLGALLNRDDTRRLLRGQTIARMRAVAVRYRKFPLFSSWSTLLNTASWQLPALMLGYFFNSATVGFYALGFRLLQLPVGLIGGSIGQVFFQRAARAKHEGHLAELVRGMYEALLDVGLLPMVAVGIAGPEIFTAVLGPQWHEAGVYAQILAPWTLVWFLSSPLHNLFSVLELQGLGLWMNILIFVSRFASLAAGGWLGSARLAVVLFAASGVLAYGYAACLAMSRSGVNGSAVLSGTARELLGAIPATAALLIMKYLAVNEWVILSVAGAMVLSKWAFVFNRARNGRIPLYRTTEPAEGQYPPQGPVPPEQAP